MFSRFALFHDLPVEAITTLFPLQNHPLFKRADLGKYRGIADIARNFKIFMQGQDTKCRRRTEPYPSQHVRRWEKLHDIFMLKY